MSAPPYQRTLRHTWLGQPATAANTVPVTAGLDVNNLAPILVQARLKINGASINVAIVGLLKDQYWKAYTAANVIAAVTDNTANAQAGTANNFPLETNAANSGCLFASPLPLGCIGIDATTNSTGSPTRVLEYWDGTQWTAIAAAGTLIDLARTTHWGTVENVIAFVPPANMAKGGTPVATVPQDTFNVRIRATAAATVAGVARRIYLGYVFSGEPALAANGTHTAPWENLQGWPCPGAVAAIGGAVSGTANEGHVLSVVYR